MSGRGPEAVLGELGADLRAASARPPRRARLLRWPRGLVLVLALLALVPTALATRDAIWAPDPVPLPEPATAPLGGAAPDRRPGVCRGRHAGRGGWRLAATACDYGGVAPSASSSPCRGAGGARAATSRAAPGDPRTRRSPPIAWCRPTSTPVSGRTWAFGALPAAARTVDVAGAAASPLAAAPVDPDAVTQGGLPAGLGVFVVALDGGRDVPLVTVRDAAGAALLVCRPSGRLRAAECGTDAVRFRSVDIARAGESR